MIELRGITWDHPRSTAPLAESARRYAAQTDVRVTWDARSLTAFGDASVEELAAAYDLVILDHPHVPLAAEAGCLLPLDMWIAPAQMETLAAQSAGPSHASYAYAGHQWALALDAAVQSSVRRADLLPDPPLPQSWEDVLTLSDDLRARDLWLAVPLGPTDARDSWQTVCASLGEPLGSGPDGFVSEATGIAVLILLRALVRIAHPASLDWTPITLLDHMRDTDDVAYCPLAYCYVTYARDDTPGHVLTFDPVPGVQGAILGGAGFAVSASTAHPAAACAYGAWLCGAEAARTWIVASGGQPGNAAAWTDDNANRLTHDFFRRVYPGLQAAYVRPRLAGFPAFQAGAGQTIHRYLGDGSDPRACMAALADLYAQTCARSASTAREETA
ncbi:extracellular solute-binding protein [Aggregatilinea lenta]|uniref:extracellular solute-binding protein n=1 Tax=Aggregatilinea lenta TaxID=913108 RepID=UPI000E5BEA36|nr:extracellular solute-binding protein [Aggregatilinea lenta]